MTRFATVNDLLPCDAMASNITRMIERDMQRAHVARGWYGSARRMIARLERITQHDARMIASLIAVLSPSVDWRDNYRMAIQLLRDHDSETFTRHTGRVTTMLGYGRNIRKAREMLRTNNPDLLSGPKVTRFRDAMLGLLDNDAVIDVHATNIALGTVNVFDGPQNEDVYCAIVDAYNTAARVLGWHVCEVQAAAWVVYKNTKPSRTRDNQLMFDLWI